MYPRGLLEEILGGLLRSESAHVACRQRLHFVVGAALHLRELAFETLLRRLLANIRTLRPLDGLALGVVALVCGANKNLVRHIGREHRPPTVGAEAGSGWRRDGIAPDPNDWRQKSLSPI